MKKKDWVKGKRNNNTYHNQLPYFKMAAAGWLHWCRHQCHTDCSIRIWIRSNNQNLSKLAEEQNT